MKVGDYQISNLLIGAVLLTTVAGLGIATGAAGSVADVVSDTFIPGGNATQAPDTDSDSSETDQNTDTTDSQDSDDGGSSSDSTGSTGSSDSDGGSSDSTSTQDSETGDQQDSQQQDNQQQDNQQQDNQQQDNQQQDNQQENDGNIQTSASITSPSNGQIYNTASVDITATVEAANASYEVRLDDSLKQSGQLDGTKDISSTLSVSDGTHNIKVLIKRSGETLVSKEAQFSVSTSSTNTSGSASISLFDPSSQTYSTNTVPLSVSLDASDASYQVNVDGVTKTSGSVDGSKTLDQDLNIVSGSHNMEVVISDSTGTLASDSVSFTVDTGDAGTQRTGFYSPDNLTAGGTALVRLYNSQGDPVPDTTVTVGSLGDYTTNQFGEIEFQVPYQDTITVSSSNYENTYDITQTATEPQITLTNPIDTASFDTPTGTNRDVTFEADVEITEDSGTASLIIDGSEAYTQDLSSGENSVSTTQSISPGTHNWQINVSTPEYDTSSNSRSFTINEETVPNGLSLQNNATAGEYNYVRLYNNGEPVEGTEVTVNGEVEGTTDSDGEVGFTVPNAQEITVSASGYSDITRTVEGYEYVSPVQINLNSPTEGTSINNFRKEFDWSVEAEQSGFDVEMFIDGQSRFSDSVSDSSIGYKKDLIIGNSGQHTWKIEVAQDGETYISNQTDFETTENLPLEVVESNPEEASTVNNPYVQLEYDYQADFNNSLNVLLDGNQVSEEEYPFGTNDSISKNISLRQGSHTLKFVTNIPGFRTYNNSVEFSSTEEMPVASFRYVFYDDYGENRIRYVVTPYEESTFNAILVNTQSGDETILRTHHFDNISYPVQLEGKLFDDAVDVDPSKYELYIKAESQNRDKISKSDRMPLDQ